MIDPVTGALIGQGVSALTGIFGSQQAADAQKDAAKLQADAARRNMLMGIQANEPLRYSGYQALGDINSFFGYNTAPYASANQLATSLTPLTAKQVKQALRGGASFDQIAQMGTLGSGALNGKYIKRLIKAGLSMDQIQQLRQGPMQGAPQAGGSSGSSGSSQPGQMNWDAITAAPDYQFQLQQGTKNLGNTFAARGGAASGNALRALSEFNQGLASQGLDRFISRRMNLVTGGQGSTNNVQQAGNYGTNALMGAQQQQGDARASGILGATNSVGNAINNGFNNYYMQRYLDTQNAGYNSPSPSNYGPYSGGYRLPPMVSDGNGYGVPGQKPPVWNYLDSLGG